MRPVDTRGCRFWSVRPAARSCTPAVLPFPPFGPRTAFLLAWSVQLAVLAVSGFHLGYEGVPAASAWNYLPTTHLPTVLLGGLMAISVGNVTKQLLSAAIALLYIGAFCWIVPEQNFALLAICVLIILVQFKIPMPRLLRWVTIQVAMSSLYIYLLHEPIATAAMQIRLPLPPALVAVGTIGVSCILAAYSREHIRITASVLSPPKSSTHER